jgi:hypothetical protein
VIFLISFGLKLFKALEEPKIKISALIWLLMSFSILVSCLYFGATIDIPKPKNWSRHIMKNIQMITDMYFFSPISKIENTQNLLVATHLIKLQQIPKMYKI